MSSPFIPNSFTYGDLPNGGMLAPIVVTGRDPSDTIDVSYPAGYLWLSNLELGGTGSAFIQSGNSAGLPNWSSLSAGIAGALNTLSDGSIVVSPIAGNIAIEGTANQIVSTGVAPAHEIVLSLPGNVIFPGSAQTTTTFQVGTDLTVLNSASIGNDLSVTDDVTIGGDLNVSGAITLAGLTVAGTVNLNVTGNADTNIGNALGSGAILIDVPSGDLTINGNANEIHIGDDAAANIISIGSDTGAASLTLTAGTGDMLLTGAVTTAITIGDVAQTGTLTFGLSTAGQNINIGSGINASAQTITIGNGASAANSTVNILSGVGTAGAGVLALGNNTRVTTIGLGNIAPAASRTITIAGGNQAQNDTVSVLNGNPSANTQTFNLLGGTATGGTQVLNLGNGIGGSLTINMGNGVNSTAQTINIANADSASGASTVNILDGATPGASQTLAVMAGVASAGTQSIQLLGGAKTTGSANYQVFNGNIAGATCTINEFSGTIASGTCTYNLFNGNASGGTLAVNIVGDVAATTAVAVKLCTGAAAHTLTVGDAGGASGLIKIIAGSGNFQLNAGAAAATMSIGSATQTGQITIGQSTAAGGQTIEIQGGVNTGTVVTNINNGASGAASQVNILCGIGTAGTSTLKMANNTRVATIDLGNIAPAAARTFTIAGGNQAQNDTINILGGNPSAGTQTFSVLNGIPTGGTQAVNIVGDNNTRAATVKIATGGAAHLLTLGSTTGAAATTINAGTGNITMVGNVIKTTAPAFLSYLAATVNNKTGTGTAYTLGTDALTEVFDRGSNASTAGVFTAPVTGLYWLKSQITLTGCTIATTFVISIVATSRTAIYTFIKAAGAQDESVSVDSLFDMTATDTAHVTIAVSGEGADTVDILGAASLQSYFTGYLVA